MPARLATGALGAAQLYLVDAPAGLAAMLSIVALCQTA